MSKVLAVCHSIGDSQVIFESAKEMAKSAMQTSILVVGVNARSKIQSLIEGLSSSEKALISMQDLDTLLPESKPVQNNLLTLDNTDIDKLTDSLNIPTFSALLVGTPSYTKVEEQCDIPEQLLTNWAPTIQSAVVSDYAFYDPAHHLATHRWFEKANKFFLPFAKAKTSFGISEEDTTAVVVGHPSIDAAKELYGKWMQKRTEAYDPLITSVREKLALKPEEKFIFVAGGKAGDEDMIKALAQTCNAFPDIKIFLGMHPAADASYLATIQTIIDANHVGDQIKFIPKGAVTTDEAVYAANGVMTVSSTVGTIAADACGKKVAFYQEGKPVDDLSKPFIISENESALFCTAQKDLLPFFNTVRNLNVRLEKTAAENIAREMKVLMKMK